MKKQVPLWALLCAVALPPTAFGAGTDQVADFGISTGELSWSPITRAEGWTLTVAGQGIYWRNKFESSQPISVTPVAPDGQRLPDGKYNWELRAIPSVAPDGSLRDRVGLQERSMVSRSRSRSSVQFERRGLTRPMVTSGSFVVENGAFVMPKISGQPITGGTEESK